MSADSRSRLPEPEYSHDRSGRLSPEPEITDQGESDMPDGFQLEAPKRSFRLAHDKQKKLFVVTWPDGEINYFRYQPASQ